MVHNHKGFFVQVFIEMSFVHIEIRVNLKYNLRGECKRVLSANLNKGAELFPLSS